MTSLATCRRLLSMTNNVPFHGTFSRHGKAQASLALLIWLNENVGFGDKEILQILGDNEILQVWFKEILSV